FLQGDPLKEQLCKRRFFEGGCASVIRRDAMLWLVGLNFHELGPWNDSMGYSLVAWKHGAVYLPQAFGGFTIHAEGGYNDEVVAADAKALAYFDRVGKFLRQPEIQAFTPPEILNALERKVFGRFTPTTMQAWLKAQDLSQARKYSQYGQWELAALI